MIQSILAPNREEHHEETEEVFGPCDWDVPTFQAIKDKIGERGIVEIIGSAGQYQMVSLFMNVDRYLHSTRSQS